jgi:hypothetical protein
MPTTDAAYAGVQISEHMARTPEGFLIVCAVPIARTAEKVAQIYDASEVNDSGSGAVKVYRRSEEVFSPVFMASLESKPLVSPHPSEFVTRDNWQAFVKGHITNPRRGPKLDNGETSLIADLIVYDSVLADQIERGFLREVSCGYSCRYSPYKSGFQQTDLVANHCAVVFKGRAGPEVRITDAEGKVKQTPQELIQEVNRARAMAGVEGDNEEEPVSFVDRMRKANPAYSAFDENQRAGQAFSDAAKKAGRELAQRFPGQNCTDSAAPVMPHVDPAEDFETAARRVRTAMLGRYKV